MACQLGKGTARQIPDSLLPYRRSERAPTWTHRMANKLIEKGPQSLSTEFYCTDQRSATAHWSTVRNCCWVRQQWEQIHISMKWKRLIVLAVQRDWLYKEASCRVGVATRHQATEGKCWQTNKQRQSNGSLSLHSLPEICHFLTDCHQFSAPESFLYPKGTLNKEQSKLSNARFSKQMITERGRQ